MSDRKYSGWVVTNWNTETTREEYELIMEKNGIRYIAYGEEICPQSGRPHHQLFLYLLEPRRGGPRVRKNIGSWWGDTHCYAYPMYGSFLQNENYCSKVTNGEGDCKGHRYVEIGSKPAPGARGDIKENQQLIIMGEKTPDDLCMMDPCHFHQYGRTYDRIYDIVRRNKFRTEKTEGLWLYGATGTGKTRMAYENFSPDTHYVKDTSIKWWDGYNPNKHHTIIIDEFRGEIKLQKLLQLMDRYAHTVPIRGKESMPFLAKKVIITSCYSPKRLAKIHWDLDGHDNLDQLIRRCQVRELIGNE